jgi:hypothetical protein
LDGVFQKPNDRLGLKRPPEVQKLFPKFYIPSTQRVPEESAQGVLNRKGRVTGRGDDRLIVAKFNRVPAKI